MPKLTPIFHKGCTLETLRPMFKAHRYVWTNSFISLAEIIRKRRENCKNS